MFTFTTFLLGVIHKHVRTLGVGRSGPAKSVLGRIIGKEGGSAVSVSTPYFFFASSLQNRDKIKKVGYSYIRIYQFPYPRTDKKCNLDPSALQ